MLNFCPASLETNLFKMKKIRTAMRIFDAEAISGNSSLRPGLLRDHVLDFSDGLRLIISYDQLPVGVHLHVSATAADGEIVRAMMAMPMPGRIPYFVGLVTYRMGELGIQDMGLLGASQNGVFHFLSVEPVLQEQNQ